MFGWLIELRNFFLALGLAWIGVSLEPAAEPFEPQKEATPIIADNDAVSDQNRKTP